MAFAPTFDQTTRLVARTLGISPQDLEASFRPAAFVDLPALLALRQDSIAGEIRWNDHEYLSWRYRLGRKGVGLGELWVSESGGKLLGMVGAEEMACLHKGRRLAGQRTMDILVAPQLRNSGLGVWLNQAMFRQAEFTLAVGANRNSIGTVRRLYCMIVPRRTYVHPIDFNAYFTRRMTSGVAAGVVASLANATMRIWRGLLKLFDRGEMNFRAIGRFEQGLDGLAASSTEGGDEVVVERNSNYLNVRLFENPRARYKVWEALRASESQGFVAMRVAMRADGTRWMHVIDLYAYDAGPRREVMKALLLFVVQEAAREKCTTAAVTLQGDFYRGMLRGIGFFPRRPDEAMVVGVHAEPALQESLAAGHWSLTDLSVDHDGY